MTEAQPKDGRTQLIKVRFVEKARNDPKFQASAQKPHPDPVAAVLDGVGIALTPGTPRFVLSEAEPDLTGNTASEEIDIDRLLGSYNHRRETESLYRKPLVRVASQLGCDVSDLEFVVRVHETGHRVVHRGCLPSETSSWIGALEKPDLVGMKRRRTESYKSLDRESHEFIAQVLAWVAIQHVKRQNEVLGAQLEGVFFALMERSSTVYKVPREFLEKYVNSKAVRELLAYIWNRASLGRAPVSRSGMEEFLTVAVVGLHCQGGGQGGLR